VAELTTFGETIVVKGLKSGRVKQRKGRGWGFKNQNIKTKRGKERAGRTPAIERRKKNLT